MRTNIKSIIKILWKIYVCVCVACCTFMGIFILNIEMFYWDKCARFPNGVKLTSYFLHKNGFKVLSERGKTLLKAGNGEVVSQNDFVFGLAGIDGVNKNFIYKIGWSEPMIFNKDSIPSYDDMLNKYDLHEYLDYPPTLFEGDDYKECTEHDGRFDCDFKMIEKYWADVESGRKTRYKCDRKNKNEDCGGYRLYKTLLDLEYMYRYSCN